MPTRATSKVPILHVTNFTAHPLCEKDMKMIYSKLPGHSHSQLNVLERRNKKKGYGADVSADIFMAVKKVEFCWHCKLLSG